MNASVIVEANVGDGVDVDDGVSVIVNMGGGVDDAVIVFVNAGGGADVDGSGNEGDSACEDWTADAIFEEDARRTPWTQHPDGVVVVGLLRAMAITILAMLRAMSRFKRDSAWETPTWKTCVEQALLVLFEPLLDMGAFSAFECEEPREI